MATVHPSTQTVDEIVADWPDSRPGQSQQPKETAQQMREKYGEPDEATPQRLTWYDNGPWSRTEVYREGQEHRFPVPHVDHLYQYLDYQVPPEKYDDLAKFDGSVHPHRTEGELLVTCHTEEANVLAINLAHDVVTEEKSVEEAREAYAAINAKLMAGRSPDYASEFQFSLPEGDQRDPDVTIVTDEVKRRTRLVAAVAFVAVAVWLYRRRRGGQSERDGQTDRESTEIDPKQRRLDVT